MFDASEKENVRRKLAEEMHKVAALKLITVDGYRAEFADGWFLVRLSGTEPKLRMTAEARSKEELDRLMYLGRGVIKRCLK